ncbi:neutral zinc metallopeptidase [Dactylosporangium sp. CS-033363]|uniref:neutral zinc metallopeptidase n=1 Tax=Dactylosporangium sp. CS-033363 TaxID=3239935 RepID=UPI003D8C7251
MKRPPRLSLLILLAVLYWLPARSAHADSYGGFTTDLNIAIRVAEHYWGAKIVGFHPISKIIPYVVDGQISCGTQPIPAQNAAYCPIGDFIAYDRNWSEQVYNDMGDAFVFYLLGHEYGHGIQQRLGIQYQFTIYQELQADCFSGAMIGDSIKTGDLTLDTGDVEELKAGLVSVGDPPDEPWFQEGAHGSPEQRESSFFGGYDNSLDACDMPAGHGSVAAPAAPGFPAPTPTDSANPFPGTRNPFPGWTNPLPQPTTPMWPW